MDRVHRTYGLKPFLILDVMERVVPRISALMPPPPLSQLTSTPLTNTDAFSDNRH